MTRNQFLRERYKLQFDVGNYAFGSAPRHPLEAVIKNCIRAQQEPEWWHEMLGGMPRILWKDLTVLYTTGPGLVSRTFAEFPDGDGSVKILFAGDIATRIRGTGSGTMDCTS